MRLPTCTLMIASAFLAAAAPPPPAAAPERLIHERRDVALQQWQKRDRVDSALVLPVRIGLRQQNLHRAEEYILDVSHPTSPNYGQHWSPERIASTFAPSDESVSAVRAWLADAGIEAKRVSQSFGRSWLLFNGTVAEVELLLQAEYYTYEHVAGAGRFVACDSYSVPPAVSEHVDIITPTLHFDTKRRARKQKRAPTDSRIKPRAALISSTSTSTSTSHSGNVANVASLSSVVPPADNLSDCQVTTTLACLRALYQIPRWATPHPDNSFGIVDYGPHTLFYDDLDEFFAAYEPQLVGSRPIFQSVDGGEIAIDYGNRTSVDEEAPLDVEYAMGLVAPQNVTFFAVQSALDENNESYNNFLDAIDGSYCTFEGGDDPAHDEIVPSPSYNGSAQCGIAPVPNVISTSYATDETYFTPAYMQRQCLEYMKLGLRGVTVLYSSGDSGVAGEEGYCTDPQLIGTHLEYGRFLPTFPSTCPYITSVGGTEIPYLGNVTTPEVAASLVYKSGGGFSDLFPMPSYQASTLAEFWANYPPPYNASVFNNSQTTRGFPDISANGNSFSVAINNFLWSVWGTSAATPTLGAVFTLINGERLNAGKSPVGFVNPTLYANPQVLNDILMGNNEACRYNGFSCNPGWDPVTGLGTPNYPKMLDLFMSLP